MKCQKPKCYGPCTVTLVSVQISIHSKLLQLTSLPLRVNIPKQIMAKCEDKTHTCPDNKVQIINLIIIYQ